MNKALTLLVAFIIVPCFANTESSTQNGSHLLGFRIGSSLEEVTKIITEDLNHKVIRDRKYPSDPNEWCLIDKDKEEEGYAKKNKGLFKKKPNPYRADKILRDEIWIRSEGHPRVPDAVEVELVFKRKRLEEIRIRIPFPEAKTSGLPTALTTDSFYDGNEQYYNSLVSKLENKFGTLENPSDTYTSSDYINNSESYRRKPYETSKPLSRMDKWYRKKVIEQLGTSYIGYDNKNHNPVVLLELYEGSCVNWKGTLFISVHRATETSTRTSFEGSF